MPPPSAGPFAISKLIRTCFVTALREAFKLDPNYTYVALPDGRPDFDNTLIEITDIEPISEVRTPTIIVSGLMDREGSIYFEDDLISEIHDDQGTLIGEEHGNQLRLRVDLETRAYSSPEREEITDQIYIYLKTLKDVFSTFGVEVRMVTLVSPREETVGTRIFFISGLSVDTYSEWTTTTDITASELITRFKVAVQVGLNS